MTVQDTIDALHVAYPQVSDAQALQYFRDTHREILSLAQIENGEEEISLAAGQREYALDQTDKVTQVRAAYYMKSATDVTRLAPTSTDWLDEHRPTWRKAAEQGQPTHFYREDANLGLDPIPDTTTAAGFPKVVVYGTTYQALVATDPIPQIIPSVRVYVEGMKRLYASDRDPDNYRRWDDNYRRELQAALAAISASVEDEQAPRLVPTWMRNRRIE